MVDVLIKSKNYPSLLREIHNPPKCLYTMGNVELLNRRCITIVGTRKATLYGKWVIQTLLTSRLNSLDICIVSGMALGIDTLVHKRCLEVGIPTIAVIAGGIENIYPKENHRLYEDICKQGLVIAEYNGSIEMKKGMFPMRNRILAGISDSTVVIEADIKSGSNITANLALDFGRDVYVIPGNISKNTSRGCNMLIKQGAEIITSKEDFESILGIEHDQLKLST